MGTLTLVDAAANSAVDNLATLVNGGTVEIYTAARATLLATMTLGSPAFGAASARSATINAVAADTSADASGTAAVAVFKDSGGTEEFSGTVTATGGGGVVEFATLVWNAGDTIDITGGTLSYPA